MQDPKDEKMQSHSEKRTKIRQEIMDTEEAYVTSLNVLTAIYVAHLKKEMSHAKDYALTEKEFHDMMLNLETLTNMHNQFLKELRECDPVAVAVVLNKYADLFKMYTVYLNGYEACLHALTKLKSHKKGKVLLDDIDKKLMAHNHLNLLSYLIMPVQRIPRYVLLLAELIKSSSENHPQWKNMNEAHDKFVKIAHAINDAKRKMESMAKLVDVASRITHVPSTFQIVLPYRRLIREGHLTITMESSMGAKASMKKTPRHIFLFNDYIVLSKVGDLVWKGSLTLSSAVVEHKEGEPTFSVSTAKMYICFKCEKQEDRSWITDIKEQIDKLKKVREHKRSINARNKNSMGKAGTAGGSMHSLILGSLSTLPKGEFSQLEHSITRNSSLSQFGEHHHGHSHGHHSVGEDDLDHPEMGDHDDHHHDD